MTDECWFPKVEPPGKKPEQRLSHDELIANGKRLWTCKDGRVLPLCDMEADHIHNTLKKIEGIRFRGGNWRLDYVPWLNMELAFRKLIKDELGLSSGVRITPTIRKAYEKRRELPEQKDADIALAERFAERYRNSHELRYGVNGRVFNRYEYI